MDSQKLGSHFEVLTRDFFLWLFDKIDLTITKDRIQTSGVQDGFDVQIQISKNFIIHNIYIECKNYSNSIALGHIFQKALELETNYPLENSNDLFIAINSKSIFGNKNNPEKTLQNFNNHFEFECQLLDTSNGIKEIFALNTHFYKELYGEEPDFEINEEKIIDKFKSIIFSNTPFKKVVLKEKDRFKYIGNIKPQEYFINRTFTNDRDGIEFNFKRDVGFGFDEIVSDNDKLFILGNPGAGKTTSLEQFAYNYWNIGEQNSSTPIFRNLKNFTITDTIENKLPNNYYKLKNVLLILDGIDEIVDVENFISKLEDFLSTEAILNIKLKCVISCRTNIYKSLVKNITGFSTFFMRDLEYTESIDFLKILCKSSIDHLEFNQISDSFLKNPFQIKILATYINTHNRLPTNSAVLWENYIIERLKIDASEKQKRKKFNTSLIKSQSQKVSLINELMKSNTINEDLLLKVFNDNPDYLEEFKKNPLIDIISGTSDWYYEHRNIQEYFAASAISEKELKNILEFIQIEDTGQTHPSLFNTVTFLINLIDKNTPTYNDLIIWLKENQIEILFKADSDRITKELKISVFQEYFDTECIKKTLWISTKRTFEVSEIAGFADCNENFDYLKSIISGYEKYHFRTLYSAIELLNFFTSSSYNKKEFKVFLMGQLTSKDFPIEVKSQLLRLIQKHNLVENDSTYLSNIYLLFKSKTNKQLNNSLLSLISEDDNIDKYFEFLKHEFLLANKIKDREVKDEVIRGNSYIVNELILKLSNPENFLNIIKYFFNNENRLSYLDNFETDLIEKCIQFINSDSDFILKLLSNIEDSYRFHMRDKILKEIIKSSNSEKIALNYLINNINIDKIRFFVSEIVNKDNLHDLVNSLINKGLSHQEIELFRNNIGNSSSRKLAVIFNNIMEQKGVVFKDPVFTEEKAELYKENFKKHIQDNFDILFDKKRLSIEIEKLFTNNSSISIDGLRKITSDWYDNNGHSSVIDSSISILENLMFSKGKDLLVLDNIKETINNDDLFIFKEVKKIIEQSKSSNRDLNISEIQKEEIKDWCFKEVIKIDFNAVAKPSGKNSFYYLNSYKKIKIIFYFQKLLSFDLPQSFLLSSVEFYEFDKSGEIDESFNELIKLVNNKELFDKQIIDNLNNKELLGLSISKHIEYALANKLEQTYKKIRDHIINEESVFNDRKKIEDYVQITNDTDILKELCINSDNYLYWNSIDLMFKLNINIDFCRDKSIEYLESDNERYIVEALKVLMQLNDSKAFDYVLKSLKNGYTISFHGMRFSNFNNVNDLEDLIELFDLIYNKEIDQFESSYYRDFYKTIISNLSLREDGFTNIQNILKKIKKSLEEKGSDLFYINILIDDSINSYVNYKSKPYTFQKAKEKALSLIS